jgi:hypothetical protein
MLNCFGKLLKGSVQQKLREVKNIVNGWALASGRGAGHYFGFLLLRHLVLNVFPFKINTAQIIGELCTN